MENRRDRIAPSKLVSINYFIVLKARGFPLFLTALLTAAAAFGAGGDPSPPAMGISEAVRRALAENPAAHAAAMNAAAADHRIGEARAGLYPDLAAGGGYTRHQEPMTVVPIHRPGQFPLLDDEIFDAGLQLTLPLLNGRVLAGIASARAAAAEASALGRLTEIEIVSRVTGVFIAARELADNLLLLDAHLDALGQRHRELEILASEGRVSAADLSLLESSIGEAHADRLKLEAGVMELSFSLGRLLGTGSPVRPLPSSWNEGYSGPVSGPDGFGDTGPAALQARARAEAAEHGRTAVLRSLWPELGGFAAYTWRSGSDLDFTGEWAAGISFRLPLVDAARRRSSIQAASAGLEAARSRYREARIAERSLSAASLEKRENLRRRKDLLAGASTKKELSVAAFRERYKEGRLPLSELLVQEAELLELRSRERNLVYQEIGALIEYHTLRGSLTPELLESMMEERK